MHDGLHLVRFVGRQFVVVHAEVLQVLDVVGLQVQ